MANDRDKSRTVIRKSKSILITGRSQEQIKENRKLIDDSDGSFKCNICKQNILRIITPLRNHFKEEHNISIPESEALLIIMTQKEIEDLKNVRYCFTRYGVSFVSGGAYGLGNKGR
jgi:hypothetical protein